MTKRLYYDDSYLLTFSAQVSSITAAETGSGVVLDQTAFYPSSGGQLFDTGQLGGCRVREVAEEGEMIIHLLDGQPDFSAGDDVTGIIDWERRRNHMQKHTGQHILSRAFIEVGGAPTISARLGEEDSTIELNCPGLSQELIDRVEDRANEVIFENRPVTTVYLPHERLGELPLRKIPERRETVYRIIIIDDYDWSACGGTHCRSTGSVGLIKITGREKIRSNSRLHFLTGLNALADYRWRYDQVERISNLFSRHSREAAQGVNDLLAENAGLRKELSTLKNQLQPYLIDKWYAAAHDVGGIKIVTLDFTGRDIGEAQEAAKGIIDRYPAVAIIIAGDKIVVGVADDLSFSANDIVKKVLILYGGKGGGSRRIAQGGGLSPGTAEVLLAQPQLVIDI